MKYCCEFMKEQLNYQCEKHGLDCPNVIVARCKSQFFKNSFMLIGRNSEYECNYCPSCGKKTDSILEKEDIVEDLIP